MSLSIEAEYAAHNILEMCNSKAKKMSTCCKAQVGAMLYKDGRQLNFACNTSMPDNCKVKGCHRIKVYGEDSKNHRLPSDCYALHAEINAISTAARQSLPKLYGATLYVSRYPCEACARAIVAAGITKVIYGGIEQISAQTEQIFRNAGIQVEFIYTVWGGDTVD